MSSRGAFILGRWWMLRDTRVWGTKNLFVVDGSMHPEVPTGNTQASIMVAAAHAANKILKASKRY